MLPVNHQKFQVKTATDSSQLFLADKNIVIRRQQIVDKNNSPVNVRQQGSFTNWI